MSFRIEKIVIIDDSHRLPTGGTTVKKLLDVNRVDVTLNHFL